jgi:hypothetical protein
MAHKYCRDFSKPHTSRVAMDSHRVARDVPQVRKRVDSARLNAANEPMKSG